MSNRDAKIEFIDGKCYMTGPLLLADTPNANGVVYPKAVLEQALQRLNGKTLYGTTDRVPKHPTSLADVAVVTKNIEFKNDRIECRVEILDTPKGKFLKEIISKNRQIPFGFNTLSVASLNDNVANDDLVICGFSVVPSNELK